MNSIDQLCSGDYSLEISDINGNSIISEVILISSPSEINIEGVVYDLSCIDSQDGSIAVNVNGGIEPFNLFWDNDAVGDSIINLNSGTYEVLAIDDNGCMESEIFAIDDIPLNFIESSIIPLDCEDDFYTLVIEGDNEFNYD